MTLVILSGWVALVAFIGMLATCICTYGYKCYLAKLTKTKCDDYVVSAMHKAHKWFVWFAVIAIFVHVVLAITM